MGAICSNLASGEQQVLIVATNCGTSPVTDGPSDALASDFRFKFGCVYLHTDLEESASTPSSHRQMCGYVYKYADIYSAWHADCNYRCFNTDCKRGPYLIRFDRKRFTSLGLVMETHTHTVFYVLCTLHAVLNIL